MLWWLWMWRLFYFDLALYPGHWRRNILMVIIAFLAFFSGNVPSADMIYWANWSLSHWGKSLSSACSIPFCSAFVAESINSDWFGSWSNIISFVRFESTASFSSLEQFGATPSPSAACSRKSNKCVAHKIKVWIWHHFRSKKSGAALNCFHYLSLQRLHNHLWNVILIAVWRIDDSMPNHLGWYVLQFHL